MCVSVRKVYGCFWYGVAKCMRDKSVSGNLQGCPHFEGFHCQAYCQQAKSNFFFNEGKDGRGKVHSILSEHWPRLDPDYEHHQRAVLMRSLHANREHYFWHKSI